MGIRNLMFGVTSVTIAYLIYYDSLLQNATDVLQNAIEVFFYKTQQKFRRQKVFYYKKRRFYYKMRRLLQIITVKGTFKEDQFYFLISIINKNNI